MKSPAAAAAVSAVLWLTGSTIARAATVHDFDDPAPYELYTHDYPPNDPNPSLVLPGGPSGDFLRLAHGSLPPHQNSASFLRTAPGPACQVIAEFDFRMIPGIGQADGLGFALLDTGRFDPITTLATPGVMEEPNFERSIGFGFDIYDNDPLDPKNDINANHVSVHFNGAKEYEIDADPLHLASGNWIHAEITVKAAAGTVSFRLTEGADTVEATDLPLDGLAPYEPRAWFGARSGGETADHDLDNVQITFTPCPPEDYGAWSAVMDWPLVAIHLHLLPTGEVMFWDRHGFSDGAAEARRLEEAMRAGSGGHAITGGEPIVPRLWNPVSGEIRETAAPPFDLFCSGHTQLGDGRLFIAGGHIEDNYGLDTAAIYDPWNDCWEPQDPMADGRWYPTATTLPSGDVLVTSGEIDARDPSNRLINEIPEVWQVFSKSWRPLTGAQKEFDVYPFMFVVPDGRVLKAGWEPEAELLDTSGIGSWTPVDTCGGGKRNYGSSAMLADGRALIAGGVDPATALTEIVDLSLSPPECLSTGEMTFKRRHHVATLLPDGTVVVTGGTSLPGFNDATGDVYAAEMYDPATGVWSILAAAAVRRIYHSTALLLPDARVLVAGSGHPRDGESDDEDHFDAEIFWPPYLFRGPRPMITAAPQAVRPGETFLVTTPDAATVADVTWLRPGSVTHAFNQNQRINRLAFTPTDGGLEVTAPATSNLAPPGYYMLFLLSDEGVPSEAAFVKLLPELVFADGFESGDDRAWNPGPSCGP
jgi:hypothetical protein